MTEGTKSYIIGCHQFLLHPIWCLLAWRLEYKEFPKWWELICILLHDIGICGRQYLSDDAAKKGHWERGTRLAGRVVSMMKKEPIYWIGNEGEDPWKVPLWKRAIEMCSGHCPEESRYPESKLSRADKRSRLVAPMWWTWWEYWVEFSGVRKPGHVRQWRRAVAENLKRERPLGNHELYMRERRQP